MKRINSTAGQLMAAVVTLVTSCIPAMAADTTVITTTETITTSRPIVLQGSIITAPTITVEGMHGKTVSAQSPFPIQLVKYTAANGITIFYEGARPELSIRRDELLARILIERADGAISQETSNDFVGRLSRIDERSATTPTNWRTRAYNEHVRETFKRYDHLAQQLQSTSHLGDRELNGSYVYSVY